MQRCILAFLTAALLVPWACAASAVPVQSTCPAVFSAIRTLPSRSTANGYSART